MRKTLADEQHRRWFRGEQIRVMLGRRLRSLLARCIILAGLLGNLAMGDGSEFGPPPRWHASVPASAESLVTLFSQKLNVENRQEVVDFYQSVYRASTGVPIEWTGNVSDCAAGTTSRAYADATILRVNYFRAMAGLPANVTLDPTWNMMSQEAALMMSAEGRLSHHPDSGWACYSADGVEAAAKSNLFHGRDGPVAIDGYMDDWGSINYHVAHRRWLLFPPQQVMGTGSIPLVGGRLGANALWVMGGFGPRPSQPSWVAWPPKGYIPYQVMPRVSRRWSFSYPEAGFENAIVTMTTSGTNVPVTIESLANRQGYADNTLVWVPQGVMTTRPEEDITCTVTIDGVQVENAIQSFSYTITIIDPDKPGEPEPPAIAVQPQDQVVVEGANAVFTFMATGTEPLAYQWLWEDHALAGATNAILTLTNVTFAQAGLYTVEISNVVGSITSQPARLIVDAATTTVFNRVVFEQGLIIMSWSGDGLLQESRILTGPWTDVPGARSPYSVLPDHTTGFYRLLARGDPP